MVAKFKSMKLIAPDLFLINIPRPGGVNRGRFRLVAIGVVPEAKYRGHLGHPSLPEKPLVYNVHPDHFLSGKASVLSQATSL